MIAELSNENTIGILTKDTDFLIYQYPEHVKYLSIKDFNFAALYRDQKTLETVSYSREALANHLDCVAQRINFLMSRFEVGHLPLLASLTGNANPLMPRFEVGHLPLLASLTGNDVIFKGDLATFHQSLGNYIILFHEFLI